MGMEGKKRRGARMQGYVLCRCMLSVDACMAERCIGHAAGTDICIVYERMCVCFPKMHVPVGPSGRGFCVNDIFFLQTAVGRRRDSNGTAEIYPPPPPLGFLSLLGNLTKCNKLLQANAFLFNKGWKIR